MKMLDHSQTQGICDPEKIRSVDVIGLGSIGGYTAETCVNLGVGDHNKNSSELTGWDPKFVSEHNCRMSIYGLHDIGKSKALQLAKRIEYDTGVDMTAYAHRWNGERLSQCVCVCVDDMDTRRQIWKVARRNPQVKILIDTRIDKTQISVWAINVHDGKEIEFYESMLHRNHEVYPQACGHHGLDTVSKVTAGYVGSQLVSWWMHRTKTLFVGLQLRDFSRFGEVKELV